MENPLQFDSEKTRQLYRLVAEHRIMCLEAFVSEIVARGGLIGNGNCVDYEIREVSGGEALVFGERQRMQNNTPHYIELGALLIDSQHGWEKDAVWLPPSEGVM